MRIHCNIYHTQQKERINKKRKIYLKSLKKIYSHVFFTNLLFSSSRFLFYYMSVSADCRLSHLNLLLARVSYFRFKLQTNSVCTLLFTKSSTHQSLILGTFMHEIFFLSIYFSEPRAISRNILRMVNLTFS